MWMHSKTTFLLPLHITSFWCHILHLFCGSVNNVIMVIIYLFIFTTLSFQFNSVTQSCLTLCNPVNCSMSGFPFHYQLLELAQTHIHWVGDAIQPSHPLSSPFPPAFNLSQNQGFFFFQMNQFFASGGQRIGVSVSTSVLPMNIQDWFPLGWTGWISLQSKGLSHVFSNTTVQSISSLVLGSLCIQLIWYSVSFLNLIWISVSFSRLRKFIAIISSNSFSVPFLSLLFLRSCNTNIILFDVYSLRSLKLSSF